MKRKNLIFLIVLFMPLLISSQSLVNTGVAITIKNGSAIKITGDYINQQDGRIKNEGIINLNGDWIQNSSDLTFLPATGGLVKITGPMPHILGGSSYPFFHSLKIETNVLLNKLTAISQQLDISNGMLNLGDNDLIMYGGSPIIGADQNHFINSNGNGQLNQAVDGNSVVFPMGSNMNYMPVTITNNAYSDEFAVRVFDNVLTNGLSGGQVSNYEETVKHSWVIVDGNDTNISIDYDAQFEWQGVMEGTAFDRNNCAVIHHDETSWQMDATTSATGSDPYTIEKSNTETYGVFTVQSGGINVPTIHFVTVSGAGTMDGSSWANASPSLQNMMNIAAAGEQVWVAAGTYFPESYIINTTNDRYKSFLPKDDNSIFGGFAGNEDPATFDLSQRDFTANETILSGDVGIVGDSLDNCYHVIYLDLISGLAIDGFTIEHGTGNNVADGSTWHGPGIYSTYSYFELRNSILRYNQALYTGGLWASQSGIVITETAFKNNKATSQDGGGINSSYTNLDIDHCEFTGNWANQKSGGINFNYGNLVLNNSDFIGNYGGSGGAIHISSAANTQINQCVFINNTAYVGGGALTVGYGVQTGLIEDCTFDGNSTTYQGGAIDLYHSTIEMNRLSIINNNGGGAGGGIFYLGAGTLTLTNSVIANNTAETGGGLHLFGSGNFKLANIVVAENTATFTAGIYMQASPKIFNSIVWNNTASNGFQVFLNLDSSEPQFFYCDVEGGKEAFGGPGSGTSYAFDYDNSNNFNFDPHFVDPIVNDYNIEEFSPCINSGVVMGTTGSTFPYVEASGNDWILYYNGGSINLGEYDLTLNPRIFDGNIDIGVYEFQQVIQNEYIELRVFLEGPYNGADMDPSMNNSGLLPLNQPYNSSPWNYPGTESIVGIPNNQIIDWVLVEFRDAPDATSATESTIIKTEAAFILKSGKIVGINGSSILELSSSINNKLFVVVRHRNHLDIMSSSELMRVGIYYFYDFRLDITKAYGTDAQMDLGNGHFGMFSADANADGIVNTNDNITWENHAGMHGYLPEDFNLDGQVNNSDKNDNWLPNEGEGSQVPN